MMSMFVQFRKYQPRNSALHLATEMSQSTKYNSKKAMDAPSSFQQFVT